MTRDEVLRDKGNERQKSPGTEDLKVKNVCFNAPFEVQNREQARKKFKDWFKTVGVRAL